MENYQAILNMEYKVCVWTIILLIVGVLVFLTTSIFMFRKISDKKELVISIIVAIVLFSMIFLFIGYTTAEAIAIKKDMDNNSFVTYHGKYELVYKKNSCWCYIYDGEERVQLKGPHRGSTGEYEGYVVYGKNSFWVVDTFQ